MKINFIGNFQKGYVGEAADEIHLARELALFGNNVQRVPRDVWKGFVDGDIVQADWVLPYEKADINIITKWPHFNDQKYIKKLQEMTNAPVFYWVWDYMDDQGVPDWHMKMVEACDLYLSNDVRSGDYDLDAYNKAYYFPFDVADGDLQQFQVVDKLYDVVFFGSCIGQGDRIEWLTEINKTTPITIFAWNYEDWKKRGFKAFPAVYGNEFNERVAESKVVLGFSVEPNCWGYWSNRVGKVLLAGGFLLYQYAPGMELFLKDGVEYFGSIDEAKEKIDYFLIADQEREEIAKRGNLIGRTSFTSQMRIKELIILMERFLQQKGASWQL